MTQERRRLQRVLEPDYLADLTGRSVDELRAMRAECLEIETELSYVRRLAQARIDILEAEGERRATGGSVSDLIAQLPRILADDGPRPDPAAARLSPLLAPAPNIEWKRGLEALVSDDTLAKLPMLSDDVLADSLAHLREYEAEVSGVRRSLHEVIDTIEAQLGERLKAAPR